MKLDPAFRRTLDGIPVMPADEQQALAERFARTRDPRDAQRLVLGNLRLVVKIARDLAGPRRDDLMDLVQEGTAGLAVGIRRFDPKRGVKLTTYAAWWIRSFIMRHLMDSSRVVRFGSTREGRKQFFDGTLPGPDRSLDAPVGREDGDSHARCAGVDRLADQAESRPDVCCEERESFVRFQAALADVRSTLDAREAAVLDLRLLSETPARLSDIGKKFSISGERVRQIEQRVRDDLRQRFEVPSQERAAA